MVYLVRDVVNIVLSYVKDIDSLRSLHCVSSDVDSTVRKTKVIKSSNEIGSRFLFIKTDKGEKVLKYSELKQIIGTLTIDDRDIVYFGYDAHNIAEERKSTNSDILNVVFSKVPNTDISISIKSLCYMQGIQSLVNHCSLLTRIEIQYTNGKRLCVSRRILDSNNNPSIMITFYKVDSESIQSWMFNYISNRSSLMWYSRTNTKIIKLFEEDNLLYSPLIDEDKYLKSVYEFGIFGII